MFQPGESGNSNGRKPGSRNKRTQEILDLIQGRSETDPLDALCTIITTKKRSIYCCSSCKYSRSLRPLQARHTPGPSVYSRPNRSPWFSNPSTKPRITSTIYPCVLGEANLIARARLSLGRSLNNGLISRRAGLELDLKIAASNGGSDTTIRIEDGLPQLRHKYQHEQRAISQWLHQRARHRSPQPPALTNSAEASASTESAPSEVQGQEPDYGG